MDADVLIVGAGFAGLSAAREITEAGKKVIVLEARDRVGGRVVNHSIGDDKIVEAGGQWIGPGQDRMYRLAKDLGVATFPTYDIGETVAILNGKRQRFSGDIPRLNPLITADLGQAVLRLERLARRVDVESPWETPKSEALDSVTLQSWLRRNVRTDTARDLLSLFLAALFAAEPANLSLLYTLFYIRSGVNFDTLIRTTGGAQQDRIAGGSQVLAIRLAEELGERVRLNSPVRGIRQDDGGVSVDDVQAEQVIVAIPPALAVRIEYDPPLPGWRDQLMQRMPQGAVVKVHAVYAEPFWRREGLSGQAADADQLVTFTFDNTPPDGVPGVLTGFIEADNAHEFARLPVQQRREEVFRSFIRYFGPRAGAADEYVELDWTAEEWSRGCYGAHMAPGVLTAFGPYMRRPVGRIHWAGTETAIDWAGYMEGALASGERAASEVL